MTAMDDTAPIIADTDITIDAGITVNVVRESNVIDSCAVCAKSLLLLLLLLLFDDDFDDDMEL
jgi:hypothetical protein